MKPNIFDIATKELSQDAFITWLLAFADNDNQQYDKELNLCAKEFVSMLIKKQIPNFNEPILTVEAGRQWENIDVWAEVNGKYLIIIEDKTISSEHSNQLERYKEIAEKWCSENKYETPICIYLKSGNDSVNIFNAIKEKGFAIFDRTDFITLLNNHKEIKNNIFIDFYERMINLEKLSTDFENKPLDEWNGNDWQGFFKLIETKINILKWHYVNNPNGGFWNAILNWEYWGDYPVYIQLEEGKLCFKLSTDPDDIDLPDNFDRANTRNELYNLIIEKASILGLDEIRKPDRFGNGKYMTVAVVDKENWLANEKGFVNTQKVVENLTKYLKFLREEILK